MRIEKNEMFEPIKVVLETQEEVNALFALMNHTSITEAIPVLKGWWERLKQFKTQDYEKIHNFLNKNVIKK